MKISNAPSAPCWADLATTDPAGAHRFYGELFGWQAEELPGGGGYRMFLSDGGNVGGVGRAGKRAERAPAWQPYFQVTGADEAVKRVEDVAGTVLRGPRTVTGKGRMAQCADPTGAVFGLWEPHGHPGFASVNAPGSFAWFELATVDLDLPRTFYSAVLDWQWTTGRYSGGQYTQWNVGGKVFGGMMRMTDAFPPGVAPHWLVYVSVTDCDAAAARAARLGGNVLLPPTTIDPGRFCVLADPQGAVFAVIALSAEMHV